MNGASVACPNCRLPWAETPAELVTLTECPDCLRPTRIEIFPAYARTTAIGAAAEPILVEGEAACFYHSEKRAVVPCSACGRFLCALCDLNLNGQHLCPQCLEAGQRKNRLPELTTRRALYDSTALSIAVLSLLVWPLWVVTGPAVIAVALYGWKRPGSLVSRTRVRFYVAIGLALVQLAAWFLLVFVAFSSSNSG